jgi:hypothetical protein
MGQPEIHRSGHTPLDPDAVPATRPTRPSTDPAPGAIPEDNRPGHHPEHDQDKPPLDAFAERLGIPHEGEEDAGETTGDGGERLDGATGPDQPRPDGAEAPAQTGVDAAPGTVGSRKLVVLLGLGGLAVAVAVVLRRRRRRRTGLAALTAGLGSRLGDLDALRDRIPDLDDVRDRLPDLDVRDRIPDLHVPDLRRPELHLPGLDLPDLHLPDVHVPDLRRRRRR